MAEYYPLLARAVASMRSAPPEQRRAIYDRARQALLGQLRSMQPPVPDESINRESTALDEAIARVEAEIVAPPVAAAPPAPAAPPSIPDPPPAPVAKAEAPVPAPPPPAPAPGPLRPVAPPPVPLATVSPVLTPEPPPAAIVRPEPPVPVAPPAPLPQPQPSRPTAPPAAALVAAEPSRPVLPPVPPRTGPPRPAADALSRIVSERGARPLVLRAERPGNEGDAVPDGAARVAPAMPSAPRLQVQSFADAMTLAGRDGPGRADDARDAGPAREEPARPPAPRPLARERFNPRFLILALVGIVVVAGIAYAAWRLRDRPESLSRSREALAAAQKGEQQKVKVDTRVSGDVPAASPAAGPPVRVPAEPSGVVISSDTAAPAASQPGPEVGPSTPAGSVATPAVAPDATPAARGDGVTIPVAQRAAFLVDAPDDPQKVKTFVGTVVWTTENASPGQNLPLARTVHAEIDIPDASLKLAVVFQKNDEVQFPASHMLEMRFSLGSGNTLGVIKQISVPQMRKDDSPAGDALVGLPVTITDNYFLVGLSRGDATQRNLDLIRTRNWFDVPILLASNKVGKITFEKGGPGERAIEDVMQSWR